jgi:hypothetical protein
MYSYDSPSMNHYYAALERCIYCGERNLPPGVARFSDEHIIPLSLGGNLILPEASCETCARTINKGIETVVAHQEWGLLRRKRDFPTRNRKARRESKTVTLRRVDGSEMQISLADYSTPVMMYKFGEARMLSGLPAGTDHLRWTATILTSHEEEMATQRKYPEWNKQHTLKAQPYPFARLLAKIGFAYSVAELGVESFTPLVTDIILGHSDDYFLTVGGTWDIGPAIKGGDHVTNISFRFISAKKSLLVVDIRLFSAIETPSYHVVVGEVDLENPTHLAAWVKHNRDGRLLIGPQK